jgi:hypothetical protein
MDYFENYWSSSKKQDQKFYVAFCILSSLLENHLCSLRLRRLGIATWSNVCAYYASVMAGRLIVFISCGDFPIGHSSLAKFLKTGDNRMTMWLKDFAGQDISNRINRNQVIDWLGRNITH